MRKFFFVDGVMNYHINLLKIIDSLLKKVWIVVAVAIIFAVAGLILIDDSAPDIYSAGASIYSASYVSYRDSIEGMNIMRDYVDIIRSRKVAERASAFISEVVTANEIMAMTTASFAPDSNIITIQASSANPDMAVAVANAVADAFIQEIISITAVESIKVLDSAHTARRMISTKSVAMRNRIVIISIGIFFVVGIIAITAAFDTRVAFYDEVTLNGQIELLGTIPKRKI